MKQTSNQQHKDVQHEYSQKLNQGTGFCAHKLETDYGYTEEELESLPAEATESSFGCANPLSLGDIKAGDTVIDLGCGAGMDVILAAQKVGPTGKVIGIDMTQDMARKARHNIAKAGVEAIAEIRVGLIESLPIESNSVDWVISNCVVSLSPEKDRVFAEVARVLKPGGKMLLTDQVSNPLPRWLKPLVAFKSPAAARALDLPSYLDVVRNSGLDQVRLKAKLDYDATMLEQLIRQELGKQVNVLKALLAFNPHQLFAHVVDPFVPWLSQRFANTITSIKVYAEKPSI